MSDTIRTKVLLISDTHCAPLNKSNAGKTLPFTAPLPNADLLIHCGDLTYTGKPREYEAALDMLKEIDAPVKLVIAGNHDRTLDRDWMFAHMPRKDQVAEQETRRQIDEARHLWTDPDGRARREGITYLTEGTHQISLPNGAFVTIYCSQYTPEFCGWGFVKIVSPELEYADNRELSFPYEKKEDRFNPPLRMLSDATNIAGYPVPSFTSAVAPIDILLTHGPPYARLDRTASDDLAGCPHLLRALMRSRPLLHCFGHIHEGWGAERVTWSDDADKVTDTACKISDWKEGSWKVGVADQGRHIKPVTFDFDTEKRDNGVFVNVSHTSSQPLKRGKESLLVNAAIMDVNYEPINSPWVVDLDLPKTSAR